MELPEEVILVSTLKPGAVYLYHDHEFPEKAHFFVVINQNITSTEPLYLVCASSQVDKKKDFVLRRHFPIETLVIVQPKECPFLTVKTVFDCNSILVRAIATIQKKIEAEEILRYEEVSDDLLDRLRESAMKSPMVTGNIKKCL